MMSGLMAYSCAVALLVGLAGLGLERVAAWRGAARRGIWLGALLVSLATPAIRIATSTPQQLSAFSPFAISTPKLPDSAQWIPLAHQVLTKPATLADASGSLRWPTSLAAQKYLEVAWVAGSAGLVIFYALLSLRLRLASRHWRRECIDGQLIWVTGTLGPALFGIVRPRIIMPQWAVDAPAASRALILAHEREHIAAGDAWLLLIGLLTVAALPWNLPLWWQLRRLRFAIEVDCDARVVGRGADAGTYGEMLLSVAQRRSATPDRGGRTDRACFAAAAAHTDPNQQGPAPRRMALGFYRCRVNDMRGFRSGTPSTPRPQSTGCSA